MAFTAHADGNADVFMMSCGGDGEHPCDTPKQLTRNRATDANPTWSQDGRWIYFSSDRSGSFEVWRIAATGGDPQRITRNGGYMARESADAEWLYFSKVDHGNGFWRLRLPVGSAGQEEAVVPNTPFRAGATWALGPHNLYYYPSEEEGTVRLPSVRAVDLGTGHIRDLTTGNKMLGRGLSLSSDSGYLLRTDRDRTSSVIMIAE